MLPIAGQTAGPNGLKFLKDKFCTTQFGNKGFDQIKNLKQKLKCFDRKCFI